MVDKEKKSKPRKSTDKVTKKEEYEFLMKLEQESTKSRNTTFTTILSISFILPALALKMGLDGDPTGITFMSKLVFMLGFVFFVLSLIHYVWHHRYSHIYRDELERLEEKPLEMKVYSLRDRPRIGKVGLHYDWALYMVGFCYGCITWYYVDIRKLWIPCGILLTYFLIIVIVAKKGYAIF